MIQGDFLSSKTIGKCLINRKSNPKTLYFKEILNEEMQFREINMAGATRPVIPKNLP